MRPDRERQGPTARRPQFILDDPTPRNRRERDRAIGLDIAHRCAGWLRDRNEEDLADAFLVEEAQRWL